MILVLMAHLASEIIRQKRKERREDNIGGRRHRGLGGFTGDLQTLGKIP